METMDGIQSFQDDNYCTAENIEKVAVEYVLQSQLCAFPNYAVGLQGRVTRALAILKVKTQDVGVFESTELVLHLIGVTDTIICSLLNYSLYPITGLEVHLHSQLGCVLSCWWQFFTSVKNQSHVEAACTALRIIEMWHQMLSNSKWNQAFNRIFERAAARGIKRRNEGQLKTPSPQASKVEASAKKLKASPAETKDGINEGKQVIVDITNEGSIPPKTPISSQIKKKAKNTQITNYFSKPISGKENSEGVDIASAVKTNVMASMTDGQVEFESCKTHCIAGVPADDVTVLDDDAENSDKSTGNGSTLESVKSPPTPPLPNAFALMMARARATPPSKSNACGLRAPHGFLNEHFHK